MALNQSQQKTDSPAKIFFWIGIGLLSIGVILAMSIVGSYVLTLHEIAVNNAAREAAAHAQAVAAAKLAHQQVIASCKGFGSLVKATVHANSLTKHAVAKKLSFGYQFARDVVTYYKSTGCEKFFKVTG